jgi:hypothetical protein
MPYSTCCGAHTTMTEMDICPDCLDHCDWESEEDIEERERDEQAENQIEEIKINKLN